MDTIKVDTKKLLEFASKMLELKDEFDIMMKEISSIEDTLNSVKDVSTYNQKDELYHIESLGYLISREFENLAEDLNSASKEYQNAEEQIKNSLGLMSKYVMDISIENFINKEELDSSSKVPDEFEDYESYLLSKEEAERYMNVKLFGINIDKKAYRSEEQIKDLPPMIAYKTHNKIGGVNFDYLYIYVLSKHYPKMGIMGEEEKTLGIEPYDQILEKQSYYKYDLAYTDEPERSEGIIVDGGMGGSLESEIVASEELTLANESIGPRYGERRISNKLYNKLRTKTPSKKIQKQVNENLEELIGTPDPALPGKKITGTLQADHIVSMNKIAQMEGFDTLSEEQQLKVLNNSDNFIGLSEAANKSKGPKSYSEWTVYKKDNIQVDSKFREKMIGKEREMEIKLQKQIDDFNKLNKNSK